MTQAYTGARDGAQSGFFVPVEDIRRAANAIAPRITMRGAITNHLRIARQGPAEPDPVGNDRRISS